MIIRHEAPAAHGLGFTVSLDMQMGMDTITAHALGQDILVCETFTPEETERRYTNTVRDLSELQRIALHTIDRGVPARLVLSALARLHEKRAIPDTNYIG